MLLAVRCIVSYRTSSIIQQMLSAAKHKINILANYFHLNINIIKYLLDFTYDKCYNLKNKNTSERGVFKMSKEQKIKAAVAYAGISQAKLATLLGTTASNFNQKLKRDTFTDEELEQIATALNANFEPCVFVFPDGTKI